MVAAIKRRFVVIRMDAREDQATIKQLAAEDKFVPGEVYQMNALRLLK